VERGDDLASTETPVLAMVVAEVEAAHGRRSALLACGEHVLARAVLQPFLIIGHIAILYIPGVAKIRETKELVPDPAENLWNQELRGKVLIYLLIIFPTK
jgi:hypothetical protein